MESQNSYAEALMSALSMTGSQGETSYFSNSTMQLRCTNAMEPLLKNFVKKTSDRILLNNNKGISNAIRIADTGCAVGANTLVAMETIVQIYKMICHHNHVSIPEFQVYFCDLPSNDFNTLLRTLPSQHKSILRNHQSPFASLNCEVPVSRSYFAAAVAGSHHLRLFPCKSIHFFHSTMSLHWLSRVPPEVEDRSCAAWNGQHIHISDEEVGKAYYKQFKLDITSFFRAGADELVEGGGLFIGLFGRPSRELEDFISPMEIVLKDMIQEGVVESKVLEELNIPHYLPCVEEMEEILSENEEWYEKAEVKLLNGFAFADVESVKAGEEASFGLSQERLHRSVFENMLSVHFDWQEFLVDKFFKRLNAKACENPNQSLSDKTDIVVAYLIRKKNDT